MTRLGGDKARPKAKRAISRRTTSRSVMKRETRGFKGVRHLLLRNWLGIRLPGGGGEQLPLRHSFSLSPLLIEQFLTPISTIQPQHLQTLLTKGRSIEKSSLVDCIFRVTSHSDPNPAAKDQNRRVSCLLGRGATGLRRTPWRWSGLKVTYATASKNPQDQLSRTEQLHTAERASACTARSFTFISYRSLKHQIKSRECCSLPLRHPLPDLGDTPPGDRNTPL